MGLIINCTFPIIPAFSLLIIDQFVSCFSCQSQLGLTDLIAENLMKQLSCVVWLQGWQGECDLDFFGDVDSIVVLWNCVFVASFWPYWEKIEKASCSFEYWAYSGSLGWVFGFPKWVPHDVIASRWSFDKESAVMWFWHTNDVDCMYLVHVKISTCFPRWFLETVVICMYVYVIYIYIHIYIST